MVVIQRDDTETGRSKNSGFDCPPGPAAHTYSIPSAVHKELAPRRREAVGGSGSRRGTKSVAGEVEPGHGRRIVGMEVVQCVCRDRAHDRSNAP